MTTCKQNHLFDGVAYVMNNALCDYITPLQVLFYVDSCKQFLGYV